MAAWYVFTRLPCQRHTMRHKCDKQADAHSSFRIFSSKASRELSCRSWCWAKHVNAKTFHESDRSGRVFTCLLLFDAVDPASLIFNAADFAVGASFCCCLLVWCFLKPNLITKGMAADAGVPVAIGYRHLLLEAGTRGVIRLPWQKGRNDIKLVGRIKVSSVKYTNKKHRDCSRVPVMSEVSPFKCDSSPHHWQMATTTIKTRYISEYVLKEKRLKQHSAYSSKKNKEVIVLTCLES